MREPGNWKIGHIFADEGVETEALASYGGVTRAGLDPQDTPFTKSLITADLDEVNLDNYFKEDYDLFLLHPPCYEWTKRKNETSKNLIPLAREMGEKYAKEYIIENQPGAPLHNPTILKGEMFGLPVAYERAFETSYPVEQPCFRSDYQYRHRVENTRPKAYWGSVKGYSHKHYGRQILANNSTPRAYIEWLLQPLLHDDAKPNVEQTKLIDA